jgi:hypothetical protein
MQKDHQVPGADEFGVLQEAAIDHQELVGVPSGGVERERLAVAVQVAERVQRRASAVAAPSDDGAGQLVGKVRGDRATERVDRDADRRGTVQGADGVGERADDVGPPGRVVRAGCGLDHVVLVIVGHTGGVVGGAVVGDPRWQVERRSRWLARRCGQQGR